MQRYINLANEDNFKTNILYNDADNIISKTLYVHEIGTHYINTNVKRTMIRKSCVMHFVSKGSVVFMGNEVCAGSAFVMFEDEFNRFHVTGDMPYSSSWIKFSGLNAMQLLNDAGINKKSNVYTNDFVLPVEKMLRDAVFDDYENIDLNYALTSVFYRMLSMIAPRRTTDLKKTQPSRSEQYLLCAVNFIKDNYFEDITPADVAKSVNLNKNYLCRLFKNSLKQSIKSYLTDYRINKAKLLLTKTNLSVCEISNAVGYYDSAYFSQVFKNATSLTPTKFRKNEEV